MSLFLTENQVDELRSLLGNADARQGVWDDELRLIAEKVAQWERGRLLSLLQEAEALLSSSYDVDEWPQNYESEHFRVREKIREELNNNAAL